MSTHKRGDRASSRGLLSPQVAVARTFFLDLGTARRGGRTLTLAMGGWERCRPDYALVRRRFPYFVIEYIVAGRGWVALDGRTRLVGPGEVFAYGPATAVELRCAAEQPLEKYFFALTGPGVGARLRRCGLAVGAPRSLGVSPEARSMAEDLVRAAVPGGPLAMRLAHALLEVWLLRLEEAAMRPSGPMSDPVHAAFLRGKALIDARADALGSLGEMAELVSTEPSTLGRWFRTFEGTSPYQYLLRRKMNLAAEFLLAADCLVKEAAARVGFSDPDHFSRVFRAVHGVAPRRLRVGRAGDNLGRSAT